MLLTYLDLQQPFSQYIEGKVTCSLNQPLAGAQVYFVPRLYEAITTADGVFKLSAIMPLPSTLIIAHKNYESCSITIYNLNQELVVTLNEK